MCTTKPARIHPQTTFDYLWNLVQKYVGFHGCPYSREIIMCIFWEETAFRNIDNKKGAYGFGQLTKTAIDDINQHTPFFFTPRDILDWDEESVSASVLCLMRWRAIKGSLDGGLKGYGAAFKYGAHIRWKQAEKEMKSVGLPAAEIAPLSASDGAAVAKALRLCSQPGWDPCAVV